MLSVDGCPHRALIDVSNSCTIIRDVANTSQPQSHFPNKKSKDVAVKFVQDGGCETPEHLSRLRPVCIHVRHFGEFKLSAPIGGRRS